MNRPRLMGLIALMPIAAMGCRSVTVEPVGYQGLAAVRVGNGRCQAVVVPGIDRIMQFNLLGGANVLWTDPQGAREAVRKAWPNWGGDRVCIAPQDDWPRVIGRTWPPPGDDGLVTFQHEILRDGVRITSSLVPGYDVRIERTIRLHPREAKLMQELRLLGKPAARAGAWLVTQIPVPDRLIARGPKSIPAGELPPLEGMKPLIAESTAPGVALIHRSATPDACLSRIECDELIAELNDLRFTQRRKSPAPEEYDGDVQCQVFVMGTAGNGWLELEFMTPLAAPGHPVKPLRVVWELKRR